MWSIISAGGVPSALAISVIFGCASAISTCGVAVASVQPSSFSELSSLSSGIGTPWSVEELAGEVEVALRHHVLEHLGELVARHVRVHALVLVRDHDVDAVRPVADVLVDPVELDLELLGAEADRAEHAEPAGLRSPRRRRRGSG